MVIKFYSVKVYHNSIHTYSFETWLSIKKFICFQSKCIWMLYFTTLILMLCKHVPYNCVEILSLQKSDKCMFELLKKQQIVAREIRKQNLIWKCIRKNWFFYIKEFYRFLENNTENWIMVDFVLFFQRWGM